jgi:hypothetical protein
VFERPADGRLVVPGLASDPQHAALLGSSDAVLPLSRTEDAVVVAIPELTPEPVAVVALDLAGPVDVCQPPRLAGPAGCEDVTQFVDSIAVTLANARPDAQVRYSVDGTPPRADSPAFPSRFLIDRSMTVTARFFRGERPLSTSTAVQFTKVTPRPAVQPGSVPGLVVELFEGEWDKLPDFAALKPASRGTAARFELGPYAGRERYALRLSGRITVPRTGLYTFLTISDDGSRLYVGDQLVVDNDGLHGAAEQSGHVALSAGAHPITVTYFERTGDERLEVHWAGPDLPRQPVPAEVLTHVP